MSKDTQQINRNSPSTEYPIYPSQSKKLIPVAGASTAANQGLWTDANGSGPVIFYQLMVESPGSVVVQMKDDTVMPIPSVLAGERSPIGGGKRILETATVTDTAGNDVVVTTTATGIWALGGQ